MPAKEDQVAPLTAADLLRKSITLLASSGSRSMVPMAVGDDQLLQRVSMPSPVTLPREPSALSVKGKFSTAESQ